MPSCSVTWAACSILKAACGAKATVKPKCCTSPKCWPERIRVPNTIKHVCVASRIGDGKAPGAGNSYSYCQDEQRGHRRFWLQPFGLARVLAHGVVERSLA